MPTAVVLMISFLHDRSALFEPSNSILFQSGVLNSFTRSAVNNTFRVQSI